jgi:cytochrome c
MSHHHGPDLKSYSQSGVRLDCRSAMNKGAFRMSTRYQLSICLVLLQLLAATAFSADRASRMDAKTMLNKAIAHYKLVGREQALKDFTAKKPPFRDRELYVICLGPDGTIVADGGFPHDVGVQGNAVVDVGGKGMATVARERTAAEGAGVGHFRWVNPVTRNVESKTMFFARVEADVCGVGAYSTH